MDIMDLVPFFYLISSRKKKWGRGEEGTIRCRVLVGVVCHSRISTEGMQLPSSSCTVWCTPCSCGSVVAAGGEAANQG